MNGRLVHGLVLLLVAAAPLGARSSPRSWFVEWAAGFSAIAPRDLNARLEAQRQRAEFLYRDSYEAQQRYSGGAFTYELEEDGPGLRALRGGLPLALRVGRALSGRVSLFAGLQFLGRRKSSSLRQVFRISDLRPDQVSVPGAYVVETGFPGYFLSARAWMPQLGVIVDLFRRRAWSGAIRFAAGPMFAAVRIREMQHFRMTEADGYWSEWQQAIDMSGKGTGLAAEATARLSLALTPRLRALVEAGYALRRGSSFSGPGAYAYQYRDANAAQDPQGSRWQGEWRTLEVTLQRSWGSLGYMLSGNDLGSDPAARGFRLDLSGWQLSAGLALAL